LEERGSGRLGKPFEGDGCVATATLWSAVAEPPVAAATPLWLGAER